jgi:stage II sporulation protein D
LGYHFEVWISHSVIDYSLLIIFAAHHKRGPGKLSGKLTLSTIMQLTAKSAKTVRGMVSRGRHFESIRKIAVLLFLLMILNGCRRRQLPTPTPEMDIESQFWVKILLLDNVEGCTVKIDSSFSIADDPNLQTQLPKARFDQIDTPISIQLIDGEISIGGRPFMNEEVTIVPDEPYIFKLNGDEYRGKLKLIINPEEGSFDAINLVPPEPYLAGVIGAEMPSYWEPEALKAQAIASRTYCFYIKRRFGSNRKWDMKKTASHQVYRGVSAESPQIWDIVNQTRGQVLVCKQTDGAEDIFPAYYSSVCGGQTENSENVFGDSFQPLTGVACPYCKDVAKPKFFSWPLIQFAKADIINKLFQRYPKLKELGDITNIEPAEQSDYGEFSRLTRVKLTGLNGKSDFLEAENFRLAIDPTGRKLRSTICEIVKLGDKWGFLSGRGWGHGVGMCQCGAEGMARQGKNAEQILSYYYPDSKITNFYYDE